MATTGYRHGVYASEIPTSILPARTVDSAVIFAVGTAAVHKCANPAPANTPRVYYSYDEFVQDMGWDAENFSAYTLQELAYSHFALYRGAPIVCVNVFDPLKHASEVVDEKLAFSTSSLNADTASLAHCGVRSLRLTSVPEEPVDGPVRGAGSDIASGEATFPADPVEYAEGRDYILDAATGLLTRLPEGAIPEGGPALASYVYADVSKVAPEYVYADVSKVAPEDVIGGIEPETGVSTGLELIDEVFPRFRLVPSIVLAPRFCENDAVAIVMAAKCDSINGLFKAICLVDIPSDGENAVTRYGDVPAYKEKHNLTDSLMLVCWPKVRLGENVYSLSTHMAGLMADTDADHDGIPYASPSNKRLEITSCGCLNENGEWREIWLDLAKANYLNGQGVCTASNFDGGMKSWGGRMACYPSNTDPKDCQDAIRRFFNWYQAQFILTWFAKVDEPMSRRLVQTFLKSEQIKLDGYTAREIILGGSISFAETENPSTDLIDGVMRFHLRITPPPAARDIEAIFEFDPENVKALFA